MDFDQPSKNGIPHRYFFKFRSLPPVWKTGCSRYISGEILTFTHEYIGHVVSFREG